MINLDDFGKRTAHFTDLSITYSDFSKASSEKAYSYAFKPTLHTHTYTEILVVLKGSSKIVSVADGMFISAPYMVVYPEGVPHLQINSKDAEYERCLLTCHGDILEKEGCGHLLEDKKVFAFEIDDENAELFKALTILTIVMEKENKKDLEMVKKQFFSQLSKMSKNPVHVHEEGEPIYEKSYFSDLLSYIVEHYNEKLSLTSLASMFYISRTKLARDFNAIMKMPVGEFIMMVRIKKAQEKLKKGAKVSDTAKQCGFVSTSYFVQMFKKYTKKTPLHFVKHPDKSLEPTTFLMDGTLISQKTIKKHKSKAEENT